MDEQVELLFRELSDLSEPERESYFQSRQVPAHLRAEVESLLQFDSPLDQALTKRVAGVAERILESSATMQEGRRCGPYRLVRLLGRGGAGAVYLAERKDGEVEQRVAIKFLRYGAHEPAFRDRFLQERQILAELSHPGIAGLLDAGHTEDGQPYLVMDYIDGTPIDEFACTLSLGGKLELFLRVCDAVSYAHRNLVVHRDIKPSNILVDRSGEPKLLDFGIAKMLEDENRAGIATLLTLEAGPLTPEYAAPEQMASGPVTTATDVYSLGILLFVLLTGQHPAGPGRHSYAELVKAIVETEPPRLSDVAARANGSVGGKLGRLYRGDLDTIAAKSLKKSPAERYASVAALADDVRRYLKDEPITARPDTIAYRSAKFVRRNRVAVALAALVFVTLIAGVVGTLMQARSARAQRDFAFRQLSRAEAINDLNAFLLSDAAPSGKPFTVNELLGRAEHIVDRQHGNDASRVELLISIGRQYVRQDETARGRPILAKAYQLSRGLADRSIRANAACGLADALARTGELPRAEKLIQEGLGELPNEPDFVLDRVSCLMTGSSVSRERGSSEQAIARIRAAQDLLERVPFQSELLKLRAFMDLAESYRNAGKPRQAIAAFEQASTRLAALGRDDTETAGTLYNNWGVALSFAGRPLDAEKVLRRAIEVSRANQTDEGVSPMLMVNYARALRELGRSAEAADYAERGYKKAQQAGHQIVVNQSLLLRSIIYRAMGNPALASEMISEVEPRLRHDLPAGHIAFASVAIERALNAQASGDSSSALAYSAQAVAIAEAAIKAGGQGADYLPIMLRRRADIELQAGRLNQAAEDARRAVSLQEKLSEPGTFSSIVGHSYFTLGKALLAQGKKEEARSAFAVAVQHLESSLGSQHADTVSAGKLAELPPR